MNPKRRSWLFVAGADPAAHAAAARSGADVLIQELEDFTPPELRPKARSMAAVLYARWRKAGAITAVRVNPLETDGREDLAAVMGGRLVASEDMVADLGTVRSRDGAELAYVRARFLVECRAAGVEAIDCPYTFSDVRGARADALQAKRPGYRAKSLVSPSHARAINGVFSPQKKEIEHARRIVRAFEAARAAGKERALVDGALIEIPIYAAARRLLDSLA